MRLRHYIIYMVGGCCENPYMCAGFFVFVGWLVIVFVGWLFCRRLETTHEELLQTCKRAQRK